MHQLATMTAGFDDGRPPTLVRRPGTGGEYSNDTANMLAELLTLRFGEDMREVFKRRVAGPIGMVERQWAWRNNQFRAKTIDGLASREFASGITITHRTLARIGYLYLRDGNWNGRQVLSSQFIQLATRPTELPAPWAFYAFYWGSNARQTYARIPHDTYWALGLGDSFVLVCPSLDIVAVRLGTGSKKSQLGGNDPNDDWGGRVADFFRLIIGGRQGSLRPKCVYFTENWDAGPGETQSFPTKWMSADGKGLYLVFLVMIASQSAGPISCCTPMPGLPQINLR